MGMLADKPTFAVAINGAGPFSFIYDTGAPTTVLDTAVRAQVGAGPYELGVGGRTLAAAALQSADIARTFGIPGAQGIIGTDVLGQLVVTIDRARGRMWLDDAIDERALAACTHVTPDVTFADVELANYLYVRGRIEDTDGWLLVDTGATLGAMPQPMFDQLQAQRPRPVLGGFFTPAGIGQFFAQLATVGAIQVGTLRVEHLAIRTVPAGLLPPPSGTPFLGLLPDGFLHHALMTVDYRGRTIRWAPYAGDALAEPTFAFPVGVGLAAETTTPPHVAAVLTGSSAKAAGVAAGDEVLAINGTAISSIPLASRAFALTAGGAGVVIDVTVRGPAGTRTVALTTADLLTAP